MKDCHLDDDGGPEVIAVEAESRGHRQSLWVRAGPVFYGTSEAAKELGVWVEYQKEHMHSPMVGPVLLTPQVWRDLNRAVEHRLRRRQKLWRRWLWRLCGGR